MAFDETVQKWDEVAHTGASAAIHPAGAISDEAYERSGFEAALQVMQIFPCKPYGDYALLDYGCGNGRVARHLAGRYWSIWGYDTSLEMRRQFNGIIHPKSGRAADGPGDGYWPGVFGVYSFAVWIHHTYADGARMLKELAAQVASGTKLALQIPLYTEPREPENWTDVGVWTPEQFETAVHEAGLVVEHYTANTHAFSYDLIGAAHNALQILKKP